MRHHLLRAVSKVAGGGGPLWTPAEITTHTWLDAADASTVSLSGTKVTAWTDKSGNGRVFEQTDDTVRPTYAEQVNSNNAITFTSASQTRLISTLPASDWLLLSNNSALDFYCVLTKAANTTEFVFGTGPSGSRQGGYGLLNNSRLAHYTMTGSFAQTITNITAGGYAAYTGALLWDVRKTNTGVAADRSEISVAAAVPQKNNTQTAAFTTIPPNNTCWIGSRLSNTTWLEGFSGNLCEIIVVSSHLGSDERDRVRGYLAHKWGAAANLPSGHPYKDAAPTL
jgi:hypothetical protein